MGSWRHRWASVRRSRPPRRRTCPRRHASARETWQADTADSNAALAALDDVLANYKVDPKRVILTGVSMGGQGSWSLAAKHPERFAAVVPICGRGKVTDAQQLKGLPVWSFCGDADRDDW